MPKQKQDILARIIYIYINAVYILLITKYIYVRITS